MTEREIEVEYWAKRLTYKKEKKASWKEYLLLEKLLIADKSIVQKNTGYFTCEDVKELLGFYEIENLYSLYCEEYKKDKYEPERANFNKMLHPENKSRRNPDRYFIKALIKGLFGDSSDNTNGRSQEDKPRDKFKELKKSEREDIYEYLEFCRLVSKIRKEVFKEWDIEVGNKIIYDKLLEMEEHLGMLAGEKALIREKFDVKVPYMQKSKDAYEMDGVESEEWSELMQEVWGMSPLFPAKEYSEYIEFTQQAKDISYLKRLLKEQGEAVLSWICKCTYYEEGYAFIKDKYFWELLFLLLFISKDNLQQYIEFIPEQTINIPKCNAAKYYQHVQKILEIPPVEYYKIPFYENVDQLLKHVCDNIIPKFPVWKQYVLCNMSFELLDAAKNLYYMIFLRHRYSKEREDNSFPQEIFKLLEKENKDIEKIYKYCKV